MTKDGQREEVELGVPASWRNFYNARWYDPYLARFTQADTIRFAEALPNPTDAKAFDRYAYVNNNPVMYGIYTKGYLDISRENYKFFVPAISLGNYDKYKENHPGTTFQEYVNLGWTLYKTAKSYCRLQNNQYPCN
jgi:RHS repeat-associated protein